MKSPLRSGSNAPARVYTSAPVAATQSALRQQLNQWGFALNEPAAACADSAALLAYCDRIGAALGKPVAITASRVNSSI